jgi:hypothetical protein
MHSRKIQIKIRYIYYERHADAYLSTAEYFNKEQQKAELQLVFHVQLPPYTYQNSHKLRDVNLCVLKHTSKKDQISM